MIKKIAVICLLASGLALIGCVSNGEGISGRPPARQYLDLDQKLRDLIEAQGITRLDPGPEPDPERVALGQALFFDKILSGNRDISCATCHHPSFSAGDALPVAIGTGGTGLGDGRTLGQDGALTPRNSPEIFNRGSAEWRSMFWDSRVALGPDGEFISPAGDSLPDGLDSVLAVQAMFPVTSRDEMRGSYGDAQATGVENELALLADDDLPAIWEALMARLLSYPEYARLFGAAFPDVPAAELGFQHAANAIAAFETQAFRLYHSPWYRYLEGDDGAISGEAKAGALLFFGQAGCAACHSGPLFTDQQHHVLAVPQVGPGKGEEAPWDLGRKRETGQAADAFAFRTPSLHNVTQTGPWMHDGAFNNLVAVILHHLDPAASLRNYDPAIHLRPDYQKSFQDDAALTEQMLANLDPLLVESPPLSNKQIASLIEFLECLADPAVAELDSLVPDHVPSGLAVAD